MMKNSPLIWKDKIPKISADANKYSRGYAIINGSEISSGSTGATKLAAYAALRSGAGLVSILCRRETLPIYAASMMSVMIKIAEELNDFEQYIMDEKVSSILIGPGNGVNLVTKEKVLLALKHKKNIVLDADAITVFQENPSELFNAINSDVILTPHEGEFKRLFEFSKSKVDSAIRAANLSNATIVLKGHQTIIAKPNGEYIVHENAPSNLATAGSGDVLAGLITGLMAQKLDSFTAAAVSCYIHSEAAKIFGAGLISEDLLDLIPKVMANL